MTDLILCLVTWRISSLLVDEPAPFELLSKFRRKIGVKYDANGNAIGENELAKLFTCVWCASIWVGWFVALAHYQSWNFIVYGLAYSAGAIVIERAVSK
jgi:hypothetical protein